jgi:hypothetical protein
MSNKKVTPRMIALAIESMTTLASMLRANPDPVTAFQAARLLALLPAEQWNQTRSKLLEILGAQLDIAALEQVVAEKRHILGLESSEVTL